MIRPTLFAVCCLASVRTGGEPVGAKGVPGEGRFHVEPGQGVPGRRRCPGLGSSVRRTTRVSGHASQALHQAFGACTAPRELTQARDSKPIPTPDKIICEGDPSLTALSREQSLDLDPSFMSAPLSGRRARDPSSRVPRLWVRRSRCAIVDLRETLSSQGWCPAAVVPGRRGAVLCGLGSRRPPASSAGTGYLAPDARFSRSTS